MSYQRYLLYDNMKKNYKMFTIANYQQIQTTEKYIYIHCFETVHLLQLILIDLTNKSHFFC